MQTEPDKFLFIEQFQTTAAPFVIAVLAMTMKIKLLEKYEFEEIIQNYGRKPDDREVNL